MKWAGTICGDYQELKGSPRRGGGGGGHLNVTRREGAYF